MNYMYQCVVRQMLKRGVFLLSSSIQKWFINRYQFIFVKGFPLLTCNSFVQINFRFFGTGLPFGYVPTEQILTLKQGQNVYRTSGLEGLSYILCESFPSLLKCSIGCAVQSQIVQLLSLETPINEWPMV